MPLLVAHTTLLDISCHGIFNNGGHISHRQDVMSDAVSRSVVVIVCSDQV